MAVRLPSLRAIIAFEAAARHGTFHLAARELNLSDSAVGHAIRTLEDRLGHQLFRRTARRLILTSAGRGLLSRVAVGLSLLGEAFEARRTGPSRLTLSVLPSLGQRVLCHRLPDFQAGHGDLALDLRSSADLVDFSNSDVHAAVRYGRGRWPGVRVEHLVQPRLVAVCSPFYAGGVRPASLADLARADLIAEAHHPWSAVWREAGVTPPDIEPKLLVDDLCLALSAAQSGFGVALAPFCLVADDLAAGRLVTVPGITAASESGFWLVWSNSSPRPAEIQAFGQWIREILRGLEDQRTALLRPRIATAFAAE